MRALPAELDGHWNHNTHYYPLALAATPCARALDVGCGDGLLLRLLARRCSSVVGVDPWAECAERACAGLANVQIVAADFLAVDLDPGSFDLVASFAAIHHLPFGPALTKLAGLVAPGGRLVVVSMAAPANRLSWAASGIGIPAHQVMAHRRGYWQHPAPIADPSMTWGEVRAVTRTVLPGARYRRRLYWRYSITWTRPG